VREEDVDNWPVGEQREAAQRRDGNHCAVAACLTAVEDHSDMLTHSPSTVVDDMAGTAELDYRPP
jgi:hypothetical protein